MKILENWIAQGSVVFASVILLTMMLQIVADVVMRNTVGAGFPATADLVSRYYMVAISLLPLALTEIHRRHIEATIFTQGFRGKAKRAISWLGIGFALAVFVMMAYVSFSEAIKQTGRGSYVEVGTTVFQTWPSYWIPPVSFALMALVMLLRFFQLATGRFDSIDHDPLEEINSNAGRAE